VSDRKTELLQNFTAALGEFVTAGLRGLNSEKVFLVNAAHEQGTGSLRVVVDTNPITITVYLQPLDETLQAMELFAVHDLPSGNSN
jgi:hypothetical protein